MKKFIPIVIAVFFWAWSAVVIKILSGYFDDITQNFYRVLSAVVILVLINLVTNREEFLRAVKNVRKFVPAALLIFVYQLLWVGSVNKLAPTLAMLVHRAHVVMVVALSLVFLPDERTVIRSRAFIAGTLLSVIGVVGLIAGKGKLTYGDFNVGMAMLLTAAFCWSVYVVVMKKMLKKTEPLAAAGIVYGLTLPMFFVAVLFSGNPGAVLRVPAGINALVFVSGFFCIGLANVFNYQSIRLVGATVSSVFILVTPLFTGIVSYFVFRETLTVQQLLFGIVLLAGCFVLTLTRKFFVPAE